MKLGSLHKNDCTHAVSRSAMYSSETALSNHVFSDRKVSWNLPERLSGIGSKQSEKASRRSRYWSG